MRLFQYSREDLSVSVIMAENKEEAKDILKEFDKDININNILPLRNLLLNLVPDNGGGWSIDNIGFNTLLELPLIEECSNKKNSNDYNIIELSKFRN